MTRIEESVYDQVIRLLKKVKKDGIVYISRSAQAKFHGGWKKEQNMEDHTKSDEKVSQKIWKGLLRRYKEDPEWRGENAPIKMRNPQKSRK